VAQGDLIVGGRDRLIGRGAGAVDRKGGNLLGKLGEEAHLAADIRHQGRRYHLAEDHFVHVGAAQVRALQQLASRVAGEIHGACVLECRPRFTERRATTGDDGDAPSVSDRH